VDGGYQVVLVDHVLLRPDGVQAVVGHHLFQQHICSNCTVDRDKDWPVTNMWHIFVTLMFVTQTCTINPVLNGWPQSLQDSLTASYPWRCWFLRELV
jgi:hypothetical protein